MKQRLFLSSLLVTFSTLHAQSSAFFLEKTPHCKEMFFVKIGSFSEIKNAQKREAEADFKTDIYFLKDYYSVVSQGFSTLKQAKEDLLKREKNYPDAYIITLYKKVKEKTQVPQSAYKQGLSFYHDKHYEEALISFDRALIEDENDLEARFYYAKALYHLKIFKEAAKEFKTLLLHSVSYQQKREINQYLFLITRSEKRHFFKGALSLGVGHDDNINLTTDAITTQYGSFTLLNMRDKSASTFGLASLSLSHKYKAENFTLYSSFYNYNEFAHSQQGNDLNFIDISTALMKRFNAFSIMIPVGFNASYLDGEDIGYNIYINPRIDYQLNRYLKTYLEVSVIDNQTTFAKNRDYQALGSLVGMGYYHGKLKTAVQVGYKQYRADEDVRFDISKNSFGVQAFGKYYLMQDLFVASNLSFYHDRYTKMDTVMGYAKEDNIVRVGFSTGKYFSASALLLLKYQFGQNDSNINAYSYDKNIVSLEYKYAF